MPYKIFVINPGSTSTKIAYFEDEEKRFEANVFHDAPLLAGFPTINDQLPYRRKLILDFIRSNRIDLSDVDAIVGRGGASLPCRSGVYEITDRLLQDTIQARGGVLHPSSLGPQLARELQKIYGGRCFIVDSPMTDELNDLARVTGLTEIRRHSHLHVLNLKATVRRHCKKQGLRYEDGCYIVCHIDGGISISAHDHGRMIDGNDAAGGEGPFTPTRTGSLDVLDFIDYLKAHAEDFSRTFRAHPEDPAAAYRTYLSSVRKAFTQTSGFNSHFGTSDADLIHRQVEAGDPWVCLIWDAFIYNISKQIGAMAAVLNGRVDGIVCGGGLLRFEDLCEKLSDRCSWIAPVSFYPGEYEHEAMAEGAIRVLKGEEELQIYPEKY